nr:hypothetical protein [Mixta theicola]
MNFLSSFLKELIDDLKVYVIVISLFVFYYFVVPKYWFLCSVITVVVWGAFKIFFLKRNKGA